MFSLARTVVQRAAHCARRYTTEATQHTQAKQNNIVRLNTFPGYLTVNDIRRFLRKMNVPMPTSIRRVVHPILGRTHNWYLIYNTEQEAKQTCEKITGKSFGMWPVMPSISSEVYQHNLIVGEDQLLIASNVAPDLPVDTIKRFFGLHRLGVTRISDTKKGQRTDRVILTATNAAEAAVMASVHNGRYLAGNPVKISFII